MDVCLPTHCVQRPKQFLLFIHSAWQLMPSGIGAILGNSSCVKGHKPGWLTRVHAVPTAHVHTFLLIVSGPGWPYPWGPVGIGCTEPFNRIRLMSLHDKAQSLWLLHSAGGRHTSEQSFLAEPVNSDPMTQLHHLQNFPGEILKDVQKILITALFITVKNRNTRNTRKREPAKLMIYIMEDQEVVNSCGKLFTDRGRRSFTTKASKKTHYTVIPAFCFWKQSLKKMLE